MPDEGNVEWNKNVRVGYLDQHAVLQQGMTIGRKRKTTNVDGTDLQGNKPGYSVS